MFHEAVRFLGFYPEDSDHSEDVSVCHMCLGDIWNRLPPGDD